MDVIEIALRIELLARFRLTAGDSTTERSLPPRLQSVVALLTLHAGIPQSRERIAEQFWPDAPETQARGSLRKLLFDLRQMVPESHDLLHVDQSSVWWKAEGPWTLDARLFELACREANDLHSLDRALEMYRGELLPACYDEWLIPERERLHQLFLDVLHRAMVGAEERHEYARAIEYAGRLLEQEPLHEEQYRTLMRLHALAGNPASALRTYHLCAHTLQRELGIEPGITTREAYELLVQPAENTGYSSPAAIPLVGRQSEWRALQAAWGTAARGRSGAVLLIGEPGVGKTRLLEELLDWGVHQGIPTAYARCYAAEEKLAFSPISALLRSPSIQPGWARPSAGNASGSPSGCIDDVWLTEIARLVPELIEIHPDLPAPGPLSESWQRTRLFEAVARAILRRQPLILAVDDLQWADGESMAWLRFLLRQHGEARLLLVCTSRLDRSGANDPASLWSDLRADGHLSEIEIEPLDRQATVELAASVGGTLDEARAVHIWTESEGNPLFVIEMMRAEPSDSIPTSIRTVLDSRLAQLSPDARGLAETASVVGRAFELSVLMATQQQDEERSIRALDELWSRRIIREHDADSYDFTHDKLRQAAYEALSLPRRRMLHRKVAEGLIALTGFGVGADSAQVASHFEEAGLPAAAAPYHVLAGDAARRVFANDTAIRHYRRALALLPPDDAVDTIVKLGELLQVTGGLQEGQRLLNDGIELAEKQADQRAVARCRHLLGTALRLAGEYGAAEVQLSQARSVVEALADDGLLSAVLSQLAALHIEQGAYREAEALLQEATQRAERAADERALANAIAALAVLCVYEFDLDGAELHFSRLLRLPGTPEDPRRRGTALVNLGLIAEEKGQYRVSLELLQEGYEVLRGAGEEVMAATAVLNMSVAFRKLGGLDRASRCCAVSARLGADIGYWHVVHISLAHLGHMEAIEGKLAHAERLLEASVGPMREARLPYSLCEALYFLAELRERQGDLDSALGTAEEAVNVARGVQRRDYAFVGQILATRLERRLGKIDCATAIARLLDMEKGDPAPHRQALLAYARWQLDRGREDDRQTSAELYAQIYPNRPNSLYRQRYGELTGQDLPSPEVPDLPPSIREYPGSNHELVARAEAAMARHRAVSPV